MILHPISRYLPAIRIKELLMQIDQIKERSLASDGSTLQIEISTPIATAFSDAILMGYSCQCGFSK